MQTPSPDALQQMRDSPYNYPTTRWAMYENKAMDSASCGDLRFLATGPENTYKEPPDRYPDTPTLGPGWKYVHIGFATLTNNEADP